MLGKLERGCILLLAVFQVVISWNKQMFIRSWIGPQVELGLLDNVLDIFEIHRRILKKKMDLAIFIKQKLQAPPLVIFTTDFGGTMKKILPIQFEILNDPPL